MTIPKGFNGLYFACECVSARQENYSDPWAGVAKNKLIMDGTKEEILNIVAREPQTISQIAKVLEIAPPTVYAHINEMIRSELIRESEEWEKLHPKERYYEPNFPVVLADDRAAFEEICQEMSKQLVDVFEKALPQLEQALSETTLTEREWEFEDIAQYLYACVQRGARQMLEERGTLPPPEEHRNGVKWVFWAEHPSIHQKTG